MKKLVDLAQKLSGRLNLKETFLNSMINTCLSFSAPKTPQIFTKARYDTKDQSVYFLCYWYDDFKWKVGNLTAVYEFDNDLIDRPIFFNKTKPYMAFDSRSSDERFQARYFKFDISRRLVWMKQLILSFTLDSSPSKLVTKTVRIDVSSIFF